jgi:hypothetical protein
MPGWFSDTHDAPDVSGICVARLPRNVVYINVDDLEAIHMNFGGKTAIDRYHEEVPAQLAGLSSTHPMRSLKAGTVPCQYSMDLVGRRDALAKMTDRQFINGLNVFMSAGRDFNVAVAVPFEPFVKRGAVAQREPQRDAS